MAWGIWNKIKNGFKKVGKGIKTAVNFVKDKVVKPVVKNVIKPFKPLIGAAASAINPALGAVVNSGMEMAEDISEEDNFRPVFRRLRK